MTQSTELDERKQALLALVNSADGDGKYSDEQFDSIMQAIQGLLPLTPLPRPLDEPQRVASPWQTLFACFGPKHSAGKTLVHDTLLSYQSFNKFPDVPVRVMALEQEIHAGTGEYNNLAFIRAADGATDAVVIIRGIYTENAENRQRYEVTFHSVELTSLEGGSNEHLLSAFGLPPEQPLKVDLKANFHSDVVFCDDTLRINFGSVGGVYILQRLDHGGTSVDFSTA